MLLMDVRSIKQLLVILMKFYSIFNEQNVFLHALKHSFALGAQGFIRLLRLKERRGKKRKRVSFSISLPYL